jgi:hypothetical protein
VYGTLVDLAKAKGVAASYVSRVLRLTLLAPEIVEAILDGRQPVELQLDDLLEGFPVDWEKQQSHFASGAETAAAAFEARGYRAESGRRRRCAI